jgi:hypothetical protein
VLRVVPSGEERYYLTTFNTGVFTLRLRLPAATWCQQCILQWTYTVRIHTSFHPSIVHPSMHPSIM